MGTTILRTLPHAIPLLFCCSLSAQTIISDSTGFFWDEIVDTSFGATEAHDFRFSGGNPGEYRYMEYSLPAPPDDQSLTHVWVTHLFAFGNYTPAFEGAILSLDYAEDIRLINLSWDQAFMRSYPALEQNGRLYRANQYIEVIADTLWTTRSITGLTASDFVALDGTMDNPDFSKQGSPIQFGFWRGSSRSTTLPPIPPEDLLVYKHGIDNFTVIIHQELLPGQPPVANADSYLYLDYFQNSPAHFPVLENDFDPDGDTIHIFEVQEPAFGGMIESFNETTIHYVYDSPLQSGYDSDFFLYSITDGEHTSAEAFVTVYFCICPLECLALFLAEPDTISNPVTNPAEPIEVNRSGMDTLDLELFRRFRDEILEPTETGADLVNLYYHHAPEVMPLLLFTRRDIGRKASNALILMQDPIRSLLDGDGTEVITQALVDSVNMFVDSLMLIVSDSLLDALQSTLAQLCPFQELVGLTVADAAQSAICDSMNTAIEGPEVPQLQQSILNQNYPNPFVADNASQTNGSAETEISYAIPRTAEVQLLICDIHGRRIRTLIDEVQNTGKQSIAWDGTDDQGNAVGGGLYFYQIRVNGIRETKGMILVR